MEEREGQAVSGVDGRVRRGERNRTLIVDAILDLVAGGEMQPTAEQVAQRAGVGTRTVFRHFDDMESLFTEMARRKTAELRPLLGEVRTDGSLRERVAHLVAQRARVFEKSAPFRRSGQLQFRSKVIAQQQLETARILRTHVEAAFAPELRDAPEEIAEAIDLIASPDSWDRLRGTQRLGRDRAQRVLEAALLATLRPA